MRFKHLRELGKMGWFGIFTSLSQNSLNLVDAWMVSKISLVAVTAVGISSSILFLIQQQVTGTIASEISVFVSQSRGGKNLLDEKDKNLLSDSSKLKQIRLGAAQGILLSIKFGFLFGALFICLAPVLVQILFGADSQTTSETADYLRIVGGCAIIPCMMGMMTNILLGIKDSKAVFVAGVTMNVIHLPLGYVFIFTFDWGVKGAALATVLANLVGLVFTWLAVRTKIFGRSSLSDNWTGMTSIHNLFQLNYTWRKVQKKIFADSNSWRRHKMLQKKLVKQAIPMIGAGLVHQLALFYMNRTMLQYGTEVYAAGHIARQIKMLLTVAWVQGFASSVAPFVGECFGKKRYNEALRYCNWAIAIVSVGSAIMWGVQLFTGEWIISQFTDDAHIISMSHWMLSVLVIMDAIWAVQLVAIRSLRGVSYKKGQFTSNLIAALVLFGGVLFAIHKGWDYKFIYYMQLVYWTILCLSCVVRFYSRKWIPAETPKKTQKKKNQKWILTGFAWTPAWLPMWFPIWMPKWSREAVDKDAQ
ncbi:MATE family efflux transporter [Shimazuella kribbensis]|uniref:MATE family efflux transporter n=1 Tax=Shimazuella kribbensis TaxID=139808 RepID=UPI00040BFE35|nr:MATE family efflux transporter [Shimazuella kribbensis]